MKRNTKNKKHIIVAAVVSIVLLAAAVVLVTSISNPGSTSVFSFGRNSGNAMLTVKVVEGYTESPIEGASVVIIGTGEVYKTNSEGLTDVIEVPMVRDTRFDSVLPKPWGEVSMIIYKEGFVPYALFYLQVIENETREGVKILLFEKGITDSSEPFSIIEGPNRLWVNELIKMYQPEE